MDSTVAILYDDERWIQGQNADAIASFAPAWCRVDTIRLGTAFDRSRYDAIYCMNLASCIAGDVGSVASHAWMYPALDPENWGTRGVNPCRNSSQGKYHLRKLKAATCRNRALGEWASQFCSRVAVIPAGINPLIYFPAARCNTRLRVGWCGQVHNDDQNGQVKGYRDVWLPLVERVGDKYEMEANTNTAQNARCPAEMAEWYRSLDVFVSTSCGDGTPNPPFQSAACGAAVISTDVGQVSDWDDLHACGMIIPTYRNQTEADATVERIVNLLMWLEEPEMRRQVSEKLMASVELNYDYRTVAPATLEFVCGRDQ